jgi:hypothetical protein
MFSALLFSAALVKLKLPVMGQTGPPAIIAAGNRLDSL